MNHKQIMTILAYECGNVIADNNYDIESSIALYIKEYLGDRVKEIIEDNVHKKLSTINGNTYLSFFNRYRRFLKKTPVDTVDLLSARISLFVKMINKHSSIVTVCVNKYGNVENMTTGIVFDKKSMTCKAMGRQVGDAVIPLDEMHKNVCLMNGWLI